MKIPCLRILLFYCFINSIHGCVPQVCRKRRSVFDGSVSLQLRGCSGSSPSWVRQVASCLSMNSAQMALEIKAWYTKQYEVCIDRGCRTVKDGARDKIAIQHCLDCWLKGITTQPFLKDSHAKVSDVKDCVNKYLYSFLSNELPTLETSSAHKGTIRIPESRPSDNWWEITVRLPCKPRIFMFWNAYCINSFVHGLGNSDFALTQNNFISSEDIKFYVEFGDKCSFDQDDIKIIWSESIPSPALPQLSSFPSNFPPTQNESGNIYLNKRALRKLKIADGGMPAEFALAGKKSSPRKKRQAGGQATGTFDKIGVMFPCTVKSFNLKDVGHGKPNMVGENRRFLIDTSDLARQSAKGSKKATFSMVNFDIDYGYQETGCIFDSSDVKLVVNPEEGWVYAGLEDDSKFKSPESTLPAVGAAASGPSAPGAAVIPQTSTLFTEVSQITRNVNAVGVGYKKAIHLRIIDEKERLNCITCNDEVSNEECARNGTIATCEVGEYCATTVRQITSSKALITKTCKQRVACQNLEGQNKWGQCRPGKHGSVCRCCCYTESCNSDYLPCL